ncbi:MAG TPA: hypothetical protein VGB85_24240, partial [Nannocystis sp.]
MQRLRELVPTVAEEDDEALRDRLDAAITTAEDGGKAVRTLDVMLAEPQILIPLESFGETLYAIIKEDTVVTVLPRGHGEEILQRGQALEQRVAAGDPPPRAGERDEAWDLGRRRWRRDLPTPVVERVRSPGAAGGDDLDDPARPPEFALTSPGTPSPAAGPVAGPASTPAEEPATDEVPTTPLGAGVAARLRSRVGGNRLIAPAAGDRAAAKKPVGPVAEALARGLALARRRAAAHALRETLRQQPADAPLLPLWNLLAEKNLP